MASSVAGAGEGEVEAASRALTIDGRWLCAYACVHEYASWTTNADIDVTFRGEVMTIFSCWPTAQV